MPRPPPGRPDVCALGRSHRFRPKQGLDTGLQGPPGLHAGGQREGQLRRIWGVVLRTFDCIQYFIISEIFMAVFLNI